MNVLGISKNQQDKSFNYAVVEDGRLLRFSGNADLSSISTEVQAKCREMKINPESIELLALPANYAGEKEWENLSQDKFLHAIKKIKEINLKLAEIYSIWLENQSPQEKGFETITFPQLTWFDDKSRSQILLVDAFNNYKVLSEHKNTSIHSLINRFEQILKKPDFFQLAAAGNEAYQYFTRIDQNTESTFDLSYLEGELLKSIANYESTAYLDVSSELQEELYQDFCYDVCASLQEAIIDSLVSKMVNFAYELSINILSVVGDLAQNPRFIRIFTQQADELDYHLKFVNFNAHENPASWLAGLAFQAETRQVNCQ